MAESAPLAADERPWLEVYTGAVEQAYYYRARQNLAAFASLPDEAFDFFEDVHETKFLSAALAADIYTVASNHAELDTQGKKDIMINTTDFLRVHVHQMHGNLWFGLYENPPGKGTLIVYDVLMPNSPYTATGQSVIATDRRGDIAESIRPFGRGADVQKQYLVMLRRLTHMLLVATDTEHINHMAPAVEPD